MSLQGVIKVFVAFKTQKECSANSLLCLVGVCFHSESSSSSNSNLYVQSSPPSPHDYRKMFKVLKGEMCGAKATFFFITQDHWNVCCHHFNMTNSQGCFTMIQECTVSVSELQMASHIKQVYFGNIIPKHRGEIH